MMWLLMIFTLETGQITRYELPDHSTCTAAAALANGSGAVRAWCVPAYKLVPVRGAGQ